MNYWIPAYVSERVGTHIGTISGWGLLVTITGYICASASDPAECTRAALTTTSSILGRGHENRSLVRPV